MRRRASRGQGASEYILIVFFIAIGTLFAVSLFGDRVRAIFGESSTAVAGDPGSTPGGGSDRDMQDPDSTPGGGKGPETDPQPPGKPGPSK